MRVALCLLTVLALFWQSVLAFPIEGNPYNPKNSIRIPVARLPALGDHYADFSLRPNYSLQERGIFGAIAKAIVNKSKGKPKVQTRSSLQERSIFGAVAKGAKVFVNKIKGKPKVPANKAKPMKPAKADIVKWRPEVEAFRLLSPPDLFAA